MKLLLISTNRLGYPYYVLPIGLNVLATHLRKCGHDVRLLDLCFVEEKDVATELATAIREHEPKMIGGGVRNYCTFMDDPPGYFLPFIREVVRRCKALTDAPVVLGGGAFSNDAKQILQVVGADLGICGEGEVPMEMLLERIDAGQPYEDIDNLVFPTDSGVRKNPLAFVDDLDELPAPDRELYQLEYRNKRSELGLKARESVQTSRGCPYNCSYCFNENFYRREFKVRSPEKVVDELQGLLDRGIEEIEFINMAFNLPIGHAEGVAREMIRRDVKISWNATLHPYPLEALSPELLALFKESGCAHLEFDTVTCNKKVARGMLRPKFNKDSIVTHSKWCHDAGIPFSHHLIIGGPGEDAESVAETLGTIEECNPTGKPKVVCNVGVILGNNTRLAKRAVEEGLISEDDDLLFPPRFYVSPSFDASAVEIIQDYRTRYPDWLFVGLTLQGYLGAIENEDWDDGPKIPAGPITVGDAPSAMALHDIDRNLVDLSPNGRSAQILVFDRRTSAQIAGPWIGNMMRRYGPRPTIEVKAISAVDPLRFFVSKSFVVDNIRKASRIPGRLVDWDGKLCSAFGFDDKMRPGLVVLDADGQVRALELLDAFNPPALEKLCARIEGLLAKPEAAATAEAEA